MKYVLLASGLALFGAGLFLLKPAIEPYLSIDHYIGPHVTSTFSAIYLPKEYSERDIENQKPLAAPPEIIKAVYATGWSAGSRAKLNYLIDLIKTTELNAIVIDVKDYSGYILYDIQNEQVKKYRAKQVSIPKINSVIKRLHDDGIYVIARITVFQDPRLALARPDLAVQNNQTKTTWHDRKGLAWIDPASQEAQDYNIAIAKDAAARGFDELNFDYIRFPSDGNLEVMEFPFYNSTTTLQKTVIKNFFKYMRKELAGTPISADLFGLTTVNNDDLGIGQSFIDAIRYFDAVAPMVYPSHYANGFIGYKNPADYPYEVIKYSMEKALDKYSRLDSATNSKPLAKLRPWLQDFDLGADYDTAKVKDEIRAVDETVGKTKYFDGWMLWNPSNVYTKSALELK